VMNIVMMGAFIKKSRVVSFETMERVLEETFTRRNPGILKLNRAALLLGYNYLE
jgi:Pyruvate/2-oxoacid:ferredoxin oxidoreductase gamma subunit